MTECKVSKKTAVKDTCSSFTTNKKFWEELIAYFPSYDTGHIENDASKNVSIVAGAFVTAVTFLPSRCLATIGGFLQSSCLATIRGYLPSRSLASIGGFSTELLLRNYRGIFTQAVA
jgi:hypothetical protein